MKSYENKSHKVILVGEAGVGKSTIMLSYQKGEVVRNTGNTIGIDHSKSGVEFISKKVQTCDNKELTLNIWDTSGQ